jgi:hypothetical protein
MIKLMRNLTPYTCQQRTYFSFFKEPYIMNPCFYSLDILSKLKLAKKFDESQSSWLNSLLIRQLAFMSFKEKLKRREKLIY